MRYGFFKRGMSGFLASLIMMYGIVPGRASAETVAASDYIQPADQISDTEPDADGQTTAPEQSETDGANTVSKVYRNGTILISSFEQLEQLGSGQLVKSRDNVPDKIGQGDPVLAEDGAYVTYALDGRYALTGDIAVPAGRMWQLPEGFTGEISPDFYVAKQETDTQKQPESSETTESQETTEPEETKEAEEVTEPPVEETIDYAALEKAKEPYCKQEEHSHTEECYEKVGTLQIPALSLELPVIAEWNYPALRVAPCRYMGSVYQDNMILCAHNYSTHFGRLTELKVGDEAVFTDMEGNAYTYRMTAQEILPGTDPEAMEKGEWDLTLFTCTLGGKNRVTIRFARTE